MTKLESSQSRDIFNHAGRLAFRMSILRGNNPYPKSNDSFAGRFFASWDRGYMAEAEVAASKSRSEQEAKNKLRPRKFFPKKFQPRSAQGQRNAS